MVRQISQYNKSILVYIGDVAIPITPEKLEINRKGNNTTIETIAKGEVSIIKEPKLIEYRLQNIRLTDAPSSLDIGRWQEPDRIIKAWESKRSIKTGKPTPIKFVVTGLDISDTVTIEDIGVIHEFPRSYDKIVSITLKEYVEPKITVVARQTSNNTIQPVKTNKRADTREQSKTHTVVKGDTLWDIAKKYLGSGSRYTEITRADGKAIINPNRIYPSEVYNIPSK